jgi:transaldolase
VRLFVEHGQSVWLDQLDRASLEDGKLSRLVAAGVRGVTADPAALHSVAGFSSAYQEQLSWLFSEGWLLDKAYLELAATDARAACDLLLPLYESSHGAEGLVSLEMAPGTTRRVQDALVAARDLNRRVDRPNFLVALPASSRSLPIIRAMTSAGFNVHVSSVFSTGRYASVIEAYLSGLETFIGRGGDPATVHSVASFPLSMVAAEVEGRLKRHGERRSADLSGLAAVAHAKLAYREFGQRFSSDRWRRLARAGAAPQRPLWTSLPGTGRRRPGSYVADLMAPNSIQALSEPAVVTLLENGLGSPASSMDIHDAVDVLSRIAALGIDLDEMGAVLEQRCSDRNQDSFSRAMSRLSARRRLR